MDWKLLATTFATVFLAELGDKTQLATLTFAGTGGSRWAVFVGSALALVTTSALAVLGGEELYRYFGPSAVLPDYRPEGLVFTNAHFVPSDFARARGVKINTKNKMMNGNPSGNPDNDGT